MQTVAKLVREALFSLPAPSQTHTRTYYRHTLQTRTRTETVEEKVARVVLFSLSDFPTPSQNTHTHTNYRHELEHAHGDAGVGSQIISAGSAAPKPGSHPLTSSEVTIAQLEVCESGKTYVDVTI